MRKTPVLLTALLAGIIASGTVLADDDAIVETSMNDVSIQTAQATTTARVVDPVHAIIEKQLTAFRDRDAQAAFDLTSAKIQGKYDDDEKRFLQMMRYLYKPLYENLSYTFLDYATVGDARIQKLEVIDHDGVPTIAIYRVIRTEDNAWLVDGYTLLEAESDPI